MIKKKVILCFLIFLISLNSVSADITEGEIKFVDDYDTESTPYDAMTWLDIDFVSYLDPYPSGLMVACWDWDGDGTYSRCIGSSEPGWDACMWYFPELETICNTADCYVGNVVGNNDMWEKRSELCPSDPENCEGVKENLKVQFYVDCDLPSRARGEPTNNGENYYILSYRHYECDPAEGPYDDEIYYGSWKVWRDAVSCGANYGCDERLDGGNAKFGYYGTSAPSAPCSKENGQSCSVDSECLHYCSPSGVCVSSDCGDGDCEVGEWCVDDPCISPGSPCGGNPSFCNTCSSIQCASDDEYKRSASKYCFNNGELCCDGDSVFGQKYCRSNEAWAECSSSNHHGCQQYGNYYCTYVGGTWRWRQCTYGCNNNECYSPTFEPDISVSPESLFFTIGYG